MGLRTGKEPSPEDGYLKRVLHALDETPRMLATNLGVEIEEIQDIMDVKYNRLADVDQDDLWFAIQNHVMQRLGSLMAVKQELDKGLQKARSNRATRMARLRAYYDTKT